MVVGLQEQEMGLVENISSHLDKAGSQVRKIWDELRCQEEFNLLGMCEVVET